MLTKERFILRLSEFPDFEGISFGNPLVDFPFSAFAGEHHRPFASIGFVLLTEFPFAH